MYCGVNLVHEGLRKIEVLQRCGPPAYSDAVYESRFLTPNTTFPRPLVGSILASPLAGWQQVAVEEWVYNLGPTQFMRQLIFENGRLIEIRSLGYGG
ncbi:MAG: hypothetical protein CTY15_12535 [Methylocystis sp.]|nr:MAG: hypothetical protein CTY15_12535 [Methylocystis sp.]